MTTPYEKQTKAELIKYIETLEDKNADLEADSKNFRSIAVTYEKRAWLLCVAFLILMIAAAFMFGGEK